MVPPDADLSDTTDMDDDMDDMTENVDSAPEASEGDRLDNWAIFKDVEVLRRVHRELPQGYLSVRQDIDPTRGFYIAGPPETYIIAEGLREDDAYAIVSILNTYLQLLDNFEQLREILTLQLGVPLGQGIADVDDYLDIIDQYQLRIAQAEGTPAAIPPVTTAADLTFMHIGLYLSLSDEWGGGSTPWQITAIATVGESVRVHYSVGDSSGVYVMHKDTPVSIEGGRDNITAILAAQRKDQPESERAALPTP